MSHDAPLALAWTIPDDVDDPRWKARRRLAAALRALSALCVRTEAEPATIDAAAAAVEAEVARLSASPHKSSRDGLRDGTLIDNPMRWIDAGAMLGRSNPFSAPIAVRVEGDRVIGDLVFHHAHGGAPGCVHGGLVATALDEVLGHVPIAHGVGPVTATLDVRYVAPTPLETEMVCEAWLERRTGRRFFVAGELRAGDVVTARAKAVFVDAQTTSFAKEIVERAKEGR